MAAYRTRRRRLLACSPPDKRAVRPDTRPRKPRSRIDDLEVVLRALFVSDDERAIELSDQIRGVIERKHVSMEKRIAMIQQILRAGRIHVFGNAV
jgi:hypothetical protein